MTNVTSRFRPVPALSGRLFKQKRGRNLIAVLAIFLTAMMFTALCTLTGSMAENLTQMAFRQTGSDAEASIRGLTEEEADVFRRGRNASPHSIPKAASREEYQAATALEALFGYLYLQGKTERLNELFTLMMGA